MSAVVLFLETAVWPTYADRIILQKTNMFLFLRSISKVVIEIAYIINVVSKVVGLRKIQTLDGI
jgi:hypothetical protein